MFNQTICLVAFIRVIQPLGFIIPHALNRAERLAPHGQYLLTNLHSNSVRS